MRVCVIDFVTFHLQGFNSNISRLVGCLCAHTHTCIQLGKLFILLGCSHPGHVQALVCAVNGYLMPWHHH